MHVSAALLALLAFGEGKSCQDSQAQHSQGGATLVLQQHG